MSVTINLLVLWLLLAGCTTLGYVVGALMARAGDAE